MRSGPIRLFLAVLMLAPVVLLADTVSDLAKVMTAMQQAKSWHAVEHFSNGRTVTVDYSAPDRWRVQPAPNITELIIGDDVYMVRNGQSTRLPVGGAMIRGMIEQFQSEPMSDEIKQSARDLGMKTVNGQSVHAYSFTSHSVPETLYVGSAGLPVEAVVQDKKTTATIDYSNFNAPITIEP